MKKVPFFALLMLYFGILHSQTKKSEPPFTTKLVGSISNYDSKKIYLHHRWDEKGFTDSATVARGKFSFVIKSPDPNLYWLTMSPGIDAQPNLMFFVDEAPLSVNVKADSLPYSVVEGGPSQKDYLEYRSMINGFVQVQQKMQTDYNEAAQRGDIAVTEAIKAEYNNLNAQFLAGLKNFIKTHPRSAVSGHIVYNDLNNPNIPVEEVEEALSYIDKSLANTNFVKASRKRVSDLRGTTVGYPATNFSQNTPEGKKINLTDFRGKYVLVDFWASWCRPCRMENPHVVAAYNRYKDKGFTVLGVSLDSNREPWIAAIKQDQLTWTHVSDLKGWGNEVGKLYRVTGIPQNYLIDREGKIVAKDLRGAALDEKLAEVLKNSEKGIR